MHLLSVVISCTENHRHLCNTLSSSSTSYSIELHKCIFIASVLLFLYRYYMDRKKKKKRKPFLERAKPNHYVKGVKQSHGRMGYMGY